MSAEYRASVSRSGPQSAFGPFVFQRVIFTDSTGQQVTAWGCTTARHGCSNRKARTRGHAFAYWLRSDYSRRVWRMRRHGR